MKSKNRIIVEILETSLKVVVSVATPSGMAIISSKRYPIVGLSDAQIARVLSQAFISLKIKPKKFSVCIVIPRHAVLIRYLTLPSVHEGEIRAMIDLQIAKHIPYSKEEVVLDFIPITHEATGYSRVMVVAVEQAVAYRYWDIVAQAGVFATAITISPVGLQFWLTSKKNAAAQQANVVVACIMIDEEITELCCSSSTGIIFSRSFRMGAKDMSPDVLPEWLRQIDLTVRQLRTEKFDQPILKIILMAPASTHAYLVDALSQAYNLPIDAYSVLESNSQSKGLKDAVNDSSMACAWGVALGSHLPFLNLIPIQAKIVREKKEQRAHLLRVWILVGFLIVVGMLAFNAGKIKRSIYLAELSGEIKKMQGGIDRAQAKLKAVQQVDQLLSHRVVLADVLYELNPMIPPTTALTMLSINQAGVLVMQGISKGSSDISSLQKALLNSNVFKNPTLDYVNKRMLPEGEASSFQITCQLSGTR